MNKLYIGFGYRPSRDTTMQAMLGMVVANNELDAKKEFATTNNLHWLYCSVLEVTPEQIARAVILSDESYFKEIIKHLIYG